MTDKFIRWASSSKYKFRISWIDPLTGSTVWEDAYPVADGTYNVFITEEEYNNYQKWLDERPLLKALA
jgi:hypothetical protein